ncbi:hypothetical protein [Bradyrhizobium manausense]|nr:hypothetical protein [Bradyrhizobium manausense]
MDSVGLSYLQRDVAAQHELARPCGQSQPCRDRSASRMVLALDAEKEELRLQMHAFKDLILEKRWERLVMLVVKKLALKRGDLQADASRDAPPNDDAHASGRSDNIDALLQAAAALRAGRSALQIGEGVREVLELILATRRGCERSVPNTAAPMA